MEINRIIPTQILAESWHLFRKNLGYLFIVSLYPFALCVIIELISRYLNYEGILGFFSKILITIAGFIPWIIFAINWHRFALLDKKVSLSKSLSWSKQHNLFLLVWCIFTLPWHLVPQLPASHSFFWGYTIIMLSLMFIFTYYQCRFSILLPAFAISKNLTTKQAWNYTRGNGFLILWTGILAALIGFVICLPLLLITIFKLKYFGPQTVGNILLINISLYIYAGIEVATLSFIYKDLVINENKIYKYE